MASNEAVAGLEPTNETPTWLRTLNRESIFRAARWAWRWRFVLLMNLYLISPVLALDLRIRDKTFVFTLSASLLWLATVQLLARRVWIVHAIMAPLYLVAGVDLYVISNYQTRLASNMILTIVENIGDMRDFLEGDFVRTVGSLLLMFGLYGFFLWKIRNLRVTLPRWLLAGPLAGLAVVYGGVAYYTGSWNLALLNDRNSPFGVFSQTYLTISLHQQELRERKLAESFHFGGKRDAPPSEPETYVLVIGESARRHNFSLYGYERETNPELSKLDNLIVFKDVVTQVAQTQMSVPLIITRGSLMDKARSARETSIVSAFHEVGFRTFWLSTQQRETAMAAISRYTVEADVVRFFERQHDGVLADSLRGLLDQASDTSTKRFFLLHTLGSHFNLTSRYPREFARFPDGEESGVLHGTSASVGYRELIGAYDNTVVYTDHVLGQIVEALKKRPGIKAMLYVPDHGDNLRDDARDLFGHAHSNEYDLPIPMLFWYSDEYAARYPEKIKAALENVDQPLNTRAVFYSLTQMADVSIADPDLPKLSVFSPELTPVKRMVAGQPKPFDFDEWAAKTGTKIPKVTPPK